MALPETLQQAIEAEIGLFSFQAIAQAREELTERYRSVVSKKRHFMTTDAHRCAYLATRLPATYAVIHEVLQEVATRTIHQQVKTFLDLGAGPGSATWAASRIYSELQKITLIEKDTQLIQLGKRLAAFSDEPVLKQAHWQEGNLEHLSEVAPHDLLVLSYCIGELSPNHIPELIKTCWEAAQELLVVIEPGTPAGFERIRAVRRQLIEMGGHPVAPCPHAVTCPMTGGDWCHFSKRIERSSFHRRLKEGALGHEDEKYSYFVASKKPCPLPQTRVLRHPLYRSGHVCLTLCTPEGLKQEIVSKRTPENYKEARRVEWETLILIKTQTLTVDGKFIHKKD